jgi:ADP-ribose pyrophosphatase YjhB (NUDIX family)
MNQYSFTIRHRQGRSLAHVDYLSRNPISKVSFKEELNPWEEILPEIHRFIQQDLDTELWRPTITKVEGRIPIRGKRRTHTNEIWYNQRGEQPKTWETSRTVKETTYKMEGGLAIGRWWDEPEAVKKYYLEDSYGEVLNITTEPTKTKFSITCLYNEEGIFLSQRKNPEKVMYLLYQVPGGKCEPNETARQGAVRETFEETGIDLKPRRLKFIAYDPKFDCNIYAHKIINQMPEQREPEEMSPWCQYPWQSFKILKERNKLTPSLITFHREIMEKIGASH